MGNEKYILNTVNKGLKEVYGLYGYSSKYIK